MRFDTWMGAESWEMARSLSGKSFRGHDQHLRAILTGPLFSFGVNKQIFNSMVLFSQILHWKRTVEAYAKSTRMMLSREEVEEARSLSIARVRELLLDGYQAVCTQSDPTGHRNLLIARDMRKRLRMLFLDGNLDDPETIGKRFRPLFRSAIDAKLKLPSIQDLIDHPDARIGLLGRKKPYRKPGSRRTGRGILRGRKKSNIPRVIRKFRRVRKRARIAEAARSAKQQKRADKAAEKMKRQSLSRRKIMARVKNRVISEVKKLGRNSRPG